LGTHIYQIHTSFINRKEQKDNEGRNMGGKVKLKEKDDVIKKKRKKTARRSTES
jgi:hypothetical protein